MYYYLTNSSLTSGLQSLNKQIVVTYDKLKNPNSLTYCYHGWFYLTDATSSSVPLFRRGTDDGKNNDFQIDLSGQELILLMHDSNNGGTGRRIMTITLNFPLQKWTYFAINVYNLKTFEAYLNGKLTKTVNYNGNTSGNTNSLFIGDSKLSGYSSKFTRIPNTLDANTVWKNYLSGNGLTNVFSTIIPYGLNMSISSGDEIQRIVNIF